MGNWQAVAVVVGLIVNGSVLLTPLVRVANRLELIEYRVQSIERILEKRNGKSLAH